MEISTLPSIGSPSKAFIKPLFSSWKLLEETLPDSSNTNVTDTFGDANNIPENINKNSTYFMLNNFISLPLFILLLYWLRLANK